MERLLKILSNKPDLGRHGDGVVIMIHNITREFPQLCNIFSSNEEESIIKRRLIFFSWLVSDDTTARCEEARR